MNYIFSYLNPSRAPEEQFAYLQPLAAGETMEKWQPEMSRYWDYFATNLGTQIGTLHKHGVTNGYLHTGNIVADGTFCDIDSLEGPPLGHPRDNDRIDRDVIKVLESIGSGVDGLGYRDDPYACCQAVHQTYYDKKPRTPFSVKKMNCKKNSDQE